MQEKPNNKLITIENQVATLADRFRERPITSLDDMKEATTTLSEMNKLIDKVTTEKEKITKPLNEALKAERSRWKPIETIYQNAINSLRLKMSAYQTLQLQKRQTKETKIAQRVNSGSLSLDKALTKLETLTTPESIVTTAEGTIKFRTDKKLKITHPDLIPRTYLDVNELRLVAALKAGHDVPGARLVEVQTPINYR